MAQFANNFSWSASRDRLFRSCPRAYFYNYYGYWNGWNDRADESTKLIYKLKKLQSLPLLAGSIVHDVIQFYLETNRDIAQASSDLKLTSIADKFVAIAKTKSLNNEELEPLREAYKQVKSGQKLAATSELFQALGRSKLITAFIESSQQQNKFNNKATYLYEHYYDGQITKEQADRIKEKVYNALDAFCQSEVIKKITETPSVRWNSVDELSQYSLQPKQTEEAPIPIWCAIDFAYTDENAELWIIDWKTGKENSAELRKQLASYAIYANQEWGYDFEKIHLCGIYLNEDARFSEYPLTTEEIEAAQRDIEASSESMLALVDSNDKTTASIENFEPCVSFQCNYCNFKELCHVDETLDKDAIKSLPRDVKTIEKEIVAEEVPPSPEVEAEETKDEIIPEKIEENIEETNQNGSEVIEEVKKPRKKTALQKKREEVKELKQALSAVKKQLAQLTKQVRKAESAAHKQRETLAKKDALIDRLQTEKVETSENLKENKSTASKVLKELERQQSKNREICEQLKQEKERKRSSSSSLRKKEKQLERKDEKVKTLQAEKCVLNKALKSSTAKLNRADKRITMLAVNNISLHEEIKRLRKQQKTLLKQRIPQYDQLTLFDLSEHTSSNEEVEAEVEEVTAEVKVETVENVAEDHPTLF